MQYRSERGMGSGAFGAIGGYFELELCKGSGERYPAGLKYQSARAAFASLLNHVRPKRIWMPWYNCDTMLEAPERCGVPIRRYAIDSALLPTDLVEIKADDCLLYVNYFGICGEQVSRILERFPRDQVIIDQSQAFFSPPPECLATLYSPRKFFGLPDGGYLVTRVEVPLPSERDTDSFSRLEPLVVRFSEGPEAGYEGVRSARLSLKGQPPKLMSALTEALLATIDYDTAERRRNENFAALHQALGYRNQFPVRKPVPSGPMCYPLLLDIEGLHAWLIAHRVFVGHYWPGVRGPLDCNDDVERRLALKCVPLPCDQRYHRCDMERIIELVETFLTMHPRL